VPDDESPDPLIEVCSEISASSGQPVTWSEMTALRRYLAGRAIAPAPTSADPASPPGGSADGSSVTPAEIAAQLDAIRGHPDEGPALA